MKKIITGFENEIIIEPTEENSRLFEMTEDFALRNGDIMTVTAENGRKVIKAGHYAGIVQFSDGTQLEIFPKICAETVQTRKMIGRMMSAYLDIPFEARLADILEAPESSFMEFFISVFVRECMKILKSGLLSGYTTIEENTTSMQGSILFSENIRKNLAHRERLYVRHDVFTPDRAENRLIKSTAKVMSKLVRTRNNEQELRKILVYLDEVEDSVSTERDFAACINTRNAKKYSAVLNICRMLLKKNVSGKFVSHAVMIPMQEIFTAYITKLAKAYDRNLTVSAKSAKKFMCPDQKLFPVEPDLVVYNKDGAIICLADIRWTRFKRDNDVPPEDILRLCAYAVKFGCNELYLVYPSSGEREDISFTVKCGATAVITVKFADLSDGSPAAELFDEEYEDDLSESAEIPETEEEPEIEEIPQDEEIPAIEEEPEAEEAHETEEEPQAEEVAETEEVPPIEEVPQAEEVPSAEEIPAEKPKVPVKRKVKIVKKHKK